MEKLLQDIRYGTRSILKSPRFTVAAVMMLALGIGANTAMFSVIRSVLLRPWPFRDPGRLAFVLQGQANGNANAFSTKDFLDWKQQGGLLSQMGAHVSWQFNLSRAGTQPERVAGGLVTADLLRVFGVKPVLGREFTAQEDAAGSGNFVLLSSVLWRTRYNADAGIVGRAIQLDGAPYTVVGVMPAGYNGYDGKELLWTPLQLQLNGGLSSSPTFHWLTGCIRLPDGMSLKEARSEIGAVAARLHREDPGGDAGFGVVMQTLDDAFTSGVRPALLMLMGCVGFVLLIACANVANLLLARGASRQREMAVRTALGAAPGRIVRQLLTESVLLAGVGGAAGIAIAFLLLRGVLALHPPQVPRIEDTSIDGAVLAFSVAASVIVGILFGLAPAIEAARINVNDGLREHAGSTRRGFSRRRSMLVIVETALSCMLLVGTGLALRSLWSLRGVELGFVARNVLTLRIDVPSTFAGAQISDFYQQVVERIRAVPGVKTAAVARNLPLGGVDPSMPILTEGKMPAPVQGEIVTRFRAVGDDYFRTLQIPLLQGRDFDKRDTGSSPAVAIVSESLAKKYWPGESAVGKRIKPSFAGSQWCAVVGVAADVRHWGADVDIEPTAYYAFSQIPAGMRTVIEKSMAIAVRSNLPQSELVHSLSAAVAAVNQNVPVYDVQTMESLLSDSGSLRNFDLSLLVAFSVLALSLAAVGVYAVMAFSVSQRTREIGVRMALGANRGDVMRLILTQGARLAIAGAVIGVGGAFFLRKVLASFLFGLSANDPWVLSIVPCVMVLVILLASWVPALRATKIDPMIALRCE